MFVPVLFFPGATGTIYRQFAATILFAIAISTFNALTFSPMLSALLLALGGRSAGPSRLRHRRRGGGISLWPAGRWRRGRPGGHGGAVAAGLLVGFVLRLLTRPAPAAALHPGRRGGGTGARGGGQPGRRARLRRGGRPVWLAHARSCLAGSTGAMAASSGDTRRAWPGCLPTAR